MSVDPPLALNPWRSCFAPRSTEVAARMMMKGRPRKGASSSLETDRPRPLAGRQKGRRGSRQRGRRCSWRCARPSILGGTDRPRWRSVSALLLHSRCWGDGPRPPSWLEHVRGRRERRRLPKAKAAREAAIGKGGREAEESYARGRSLVCRTIGVGAPHSLSLSAALVPVASCTRSSDAAGHGRMHCREVIRICI